MKQQEIAKEIKYNERFVIATDYKNLLSIDTKTDDKLDFELIDLPKEEMIEEKKNTGLFAKPKKARKRKKNE